MTGWECFAEEMRKRGMTETQINSKTAAACVDILAETGTEYLSAYDARKETERIRKTADRELFNVKSECSRFEDLRDTAKREYRELRDLINKATREAEEYFESLNNALEKCETEEGRDALRTAQMFINSVKVDTKYDNTAFIIGLAAILSGKKIEPIDELKKINIKLPTIHLGDFGIVKLY